MDYLIQNSIDWKPSSKAKTNTNKADKVRKTMSGILVTGLLLGASLVSAPQAYAATESNDDVVKTVVTQTYRQNQDKFTEMAMTGKQLSDDKKKEDAEKAAEEKRQAYLNSEQGKRDQLVEAAKTRIGVPYVYGGTDPDNGMDCSGFTQWCYSQIGMDIPRTSYDQASGAVEEIAVEDAKPGDILYSGGHVGLYIGDGKFIHEPQSGETCRIDDNMSQFYSALRYL